MHPTFINTSAPMPPSPSTTTAFAETRITKPSGSTPGETLIRSLEFAYRIPKEYASFQAQKEIRGEISKKILPAHELFKKYENLKTIQDFETLLDLLKHFNFSTKVSISYLKKFLADRDLTVTRTGVGYSAEPFSIANKLCYDIAVAICHTENKPASPENIYPLLMPTIMEKLTAIYPLEFDDGSSLVSGPLPPYGTYLLGDALLQGEKGFIIDFARLSRYSEELPLFAYMFHGATEERFLPKNAIKRKVMQTLISQVTMSAHERERSRRFSSESTDFFLALDLRCINSAMSLPLRKHLEILIAGLRKGGAYHGGGIQENASIPALNAAIQFFNYWNKLPKDIKREFKKCCANGQGTTLGEIVKRLKKPDMRSWVFTSCVEDNSNLLQLILDNPENASVLDRKVQVEQNSVLPENKVTLKGKRLQGNDRINTYPPSILKQAINEATDLKFLISLLIFDPKEQPENKEITQRWCKKFLFLLDKIHTAERSRNLRNRLDDIDNRWQEIIINELAKLTDLSLFINYSLDFRWLFHILPKDEKVKVIDKLKANFFTFFVEIQDVLNIFSVINNEQIDSIFSECLQHIIDIIKKAKEPLKKLKEFLKILDSSKCGRLLDNDFFSYLFKNYRVLLDFAKSLPAAKFKAVINSISDVTRIITNEYDFKKLLQNISPDHRFHLYIAYRKKLFSFNFYLPNIIHDLNLYTKDQQIAIFGDTDFIEDQLKNSSDLIYLIGELHFYPCLDLLTIKSKHFQTIFKTIGDFNILLEFVKQNHPQKMSIIFHEKAIANKLKELLSNQSGSSKSTLHKFTENIIHLLKGNDINIHAKRHVLRAIGFKNLHLFFKTESDIEQFVLVHCVHEIRDEVKTEWKEDRDFHELLAVTKVQTYRALLIRHLPTFSQRFSEKIQFYLNVREERIFLAYLNAFFKHERNLDTQLLRIHNYVQRKFPTPPAIEAPTLAQRSLAPTAALPSPAAVLT